MPWDSGPNDTFRLPAAEPPPPLPAGVGAMAACSIREACLPAPIMPGPFEGAIGKAMVDRNAVGADFPKIPFRSFADNDGAGATTAVMPISEADRLPAEPFSAGGGATAAEFWKGIPLREDKAPSLAVGATADISGELNRRLVAAPNFADGPTARPGAAGTFA